MDNVPDIKFKYRIIRRPEKQSNNIFEYAASLSITHKNELFLQVEDICIVDFIYKLGLYNSHMNIFEFVPIDSADKVLVFNSIDSNNVEIKSDWTTKTIIVKKEDLINSIVLLRRNFEKETKAKIEKYYGQ